MWKILMRINKNLVYAIPLFMLAGFLVGGGVDATISKKMKLSIVPLTFLMVYPMMVTLNLKKRLLRVFLRCQRSEFWALSLSPWL